jgi:hypothetical protein
MNKRFQYLGDEWEASATGTAHSEPSSNLATPVNRFGVTFRRTVDPTHEHSGWISHADPQQASNQELEQALTAVVRPKVLARIAESQYVWRPAEAIAPEVGLPVSVVRRLLESSPDVIRAAIINQQGYQLYSTRHHYQKNTKWWHRYANTISGSTGSSGSS